MIGSGAGPNNCANDWLLLPCAANVGRIQPAQALCTDRICGGTFSAELSMQAATVLSTIILILFLLSVTKQKLKYLVPTVKSIIIINISYLFSQWCEGLYQFRNVNLHCENLVSELGIMAEKWWTGTTLIFYLWLTEYENLTLVLSALSEGKPLNVNGMS